MLVLKGLYTVDLIELGLLLGGPQAMFGRWIQLRPWVIHRRGVSIIYPVLRSVIETERTWPLNSIKGSEHSLQKDPATCECTRVCGRARVHASWWKRSDLVIRMFENVINDARFCSSKGLKTKCPVHEGYSILHMWSKEINILGVVS